MFKTKKECRDEVIASFSKLRRKYRDMEVENFRVINQNDIPPKILAVDPEAQGFIYNYVPETEIALEPDESGHVATGLFTDGKETHTREEWAAKLGITYQQFAKALRVGEVRIKKDRDGNRIEPYYIYGKDYKEVAPASRKTNKYQEDDKSVRMFVYYIYTSPHKVSWRDSGYDKLARIIEKLNDPVYFAEVQQRKLERRKAAKEELESLIRAGRDTKVDDDAGSEWKRSSDMSQDEMDARRAAATASDADDNDVDLQDIDIYDLGNGDGSHGGDDNDEFPDDDDGGKDRDGSDDDDKGDEDNYDSSTDSTSDDYEYSFNRGRDGEGDYSRDIEDAVAAAAEDGEWTVVTFESPTSRPKFDTFEDEESARDFYDGIDPETYDVRIFDDNGDEVDPDRMFG